MTEEQQLELGGVSHSPTIAEIASALIAAQTDLPAVLKDSENPHFKSRYASLDAIIGAVRGPLAKHGLAVVQGASAPNGEAALLVETVLVHVSGEWFSNRVIVPVAKPDPQGAGSALTYGRRYGLSALLSLATDEDDDANSAAAKPSAPRRRGPARKPPPRSIKAEVPSVATTPRKEGEDDARADQRDRIYQVIAKLNALGVPSDQLKASVGLVYGRDVESLGTAQADDAIRRLEAKMVQLEAEQLKKEEDIPF